MAVVVPFRRPKLIRVCATCQSHFEAQQEYHRLCHTCFFWMRGIRFVKAAAICMRRAQGTA
jgi:hypothetical protein